MPIEFRLFDDLITNPAIDLKRTPVFFQLCSRGEMDRRALASAVLAWRELKVERSTPITLMIGGFDTDPRELWEIPEVRGFVQRFCAKTKAYKHPALEPQSRNWLLLCGVDPDKRVTRKVISAEQSLKETMDFITAKLKE